MQREEFQARYELIEQVSEGVIESHHALHHSGVVVMVHEVGGTPEFQDRIEAAARRTGGDPPDGQILEVHQIDDQRVIVTRFLMDFWSLERWIGLDPAEVGEDPAPARADDPTAPPPAPGPPSEEHVDPIGSDEPGGAPTPGGEAPGEFTRMFQAMASPEAPPAPPSQAPTPAAAAPPPAPPAPPSGPTPASQPADSEPGEFTRMFATPEVPSAPPPPSPAPPSPPDVGSPGQTPPPAGDEGPGEFTRFFTAPEKPSSAVPPSTPAASGPPAGSPPSTVPPAGPPPPTPSLSDGPGEFTRMFQAPRSPS